MAEDVKVQVTGAEEAVKAIEHAMVMLSPTMMAGVLHGPVVEYLQHEAVARFDHEGTRSGGAWAPLLPATNEMRKALGYPEEHPINIREGELFGLMSTNEGAVASAGGGTILEWPYTNDALTLLKLNTAQSGAVSPRTPPRPVLEADADDVAAIVEIFRSWFEEFIAGKAV